MWNKVIGACTAMIFGMAFSALASTGSNKINVADGQKELKFKITWSNEAVRPELINSDGVNVTADDSLRVSEFGDNYVVYEYKSPFMSKGEWTVSYEIGNNKWVVINDITANKASTNGEADETETAKEKELLKAIDSDDLTYRADMSKVRFNWCFNGRDYGSTIDHYIVKVYEDENKKPKFETETAGTEFIIDYNKYISKYKIELSYVDVNGNESEVLRKQIVPKISDLYMHIDSDSVAHSKNITVKYGNIPDDCKVYIKLNDKEIIKNVYGDGELELELENGTNKLKIEVKSSDENGEAYKLFETEKDITYVEAGDLDIKLDKDYDGLNTTDGEIEVSGECKGAVELTINGNKIRINKDRFDAIVQLDSIGEQFINIKAADKDGRITEKRLSVNRYYTLEGGNKESNVSIEKDKDAEILDKLHKQEIETNKKLKIFKIVACIVGAVVLIGSSIIAYKVMIVEDEYDAPNEDGEIKSKKDNH